MTQVCIWQSIHSTLVGEEMPKLLLIKPKFMQMNMVKKQAEADWSGTLYQTEQHKSGKPGAVRAV